MTYGQMLASIMAAAGLATGVAMTAAELEDAGAQIVQAYEADVLAPQAELQHVYEGLMSQLKD